MDPDVAEGWYTYTLNVDTSMVIFSNNGSGQTADLSRDAGEWWYTGGKWYDEDPSDSVKPEITNITASSTVPFGTTAKRALELYLEKSNLLFLHLIIKIFQKW